MAKAKQLGIVECAFGKNIGSFDGYSIVLTRLVMIVDCAAEQELITECPVEKNNGFH